MLKGIIKLVVILAAGAAIWWWMGAGEEEVVRVEVEEVTYEEVIDDSGSQADSGGSEIEEEDEGVTPPVMEGQGEVESEEGVEDEPSDESVDATDDASPTSDSTLPTTFNLAVPFTPQAPFANWDLPYQEACEEASAYMVYMYYQGEPSGLINPNDADEAIWELVDFQNDLFDDYLDTTADETRQFIDLFYNLTVIVEEDPTVELIKEEIAAGRPVIVPAAGRELGNPFFSGDGPLYHMLVIKGYTEDQFIVNDPGTKRGQDYVYDIDVLMSAIGDWNDGDPANGAKRVILLAP